MNVSDVIAMLSRTRFPLQNEKLLQLEIARVIPEFIPEYPLSFVHDGARPIDFFHCDSGLGIEVKIQGSRKAIYRQVRDYCESFELKHLILLTNRSMGLPSEINSKPCYVVNLGKAWL